MRTDNRMPKEKKPIMFYKALHRKQKIEQQ